LNRVKIYEIEDFSAVSLPVTIPAIKGIMKVHQIFAMERGIIHTRDVSCYCTENCMCFNPVKHNVHALKSSQPKDYLLESVVRKQIESLFTEQSDIERVAEEDLVMENAVTAVTEPLTEDDFEMNE